MVKRDRLRFLQCEAGALLSDPDFIAMDKGRRGVFLSLMLILADQGGKTLYDPVVLSRATGCRSRTEFENVFETIRRAFTIRHGYLKHPSVTDAVGRAHKAREDRALGGRRKAEMKDAERHLPPALSTPPEAAQHDKGKESEGKGNEVKESLRFVRNGFATNSTRFGGTGLRLIGELIAILKPESQSDTRSIQNFVGWLLSCHRADESAAKIAKNKTVAIATQCATAGNPRACFMAAVKNEFNYVPPSRQGEKNDEGPTERER